MMVSFIMWLSFAHFTMRRIEKQMKDDGLPDSFLWDGVGGRIIFYAYAIALPQKIALKFDRRLIDSGLVRSYASSRDRLRAKLFLLFINVWIVGCFVGFFCGIG